MFSEIFVNDILFMTAPNIEAKHAFTTRFGGASCGVYKSMNLGLNVGDDRQTVLKNYHLLCKAFGITSDDIVVARQIHGNDISVISKSDIGALMLQTDRQSDGLITNESDVALMVFSADCTPILLHDPIVGAIGAIHAGWRGTVANIAGAAIRKMEEEFGCNPNDIHAAIGPCISKCCFETDIDVVSELNIILGEHASKCYDTHGNKYFVDLKKANMFLLNMAKVSNISVSDECTSCTPEKYWSHRKTNGHRGSQAALILKGFSS